MSSYQRILIKMSGEALSGKQGHGIDPVTVRQFVSEIKQVASAGKEIALVIGGGNFYRGIQGTQNGIRRVDGDYIGMLATIMNALALKNFFSEAGMETLIMSALKTEKITEPLYPPKAEKALREGKIVIFAGGTGNPFFTTDTAGVLRAIEINADLMLKATRVGGVYSDDPEKNPNAVKYNELTFDEALQKGLKIMDATAFALAKTNGLKIIVFNFNLKNNLSKILIDNQITGTIIKP